MTWTVVARCQHGAVHRLALDWQGRVELPPACGCSTPEPKPSSRLRVWWEARRMRRWLRRLNGWSEEGR